MTTAAQFDHGEADGGRQWRARSLRSPRHLQLDRRDGQARRVIDLCAVAALGHHKFPELGQRRTRGDDVPNPRVCVVSRDGVG
ncbi:MAG: hypothetical protein R2851_18190 [Caldilineaceae bacterium]